MASIIFKLADTHPDVQPTEGDAGGKNGVAWVLRFGGLMALVCCFLCPSRGSSSKIGALISRKVPPTKTEKVSLQKSDLADKVGDEAEIGRDERGE